MLFHILDHSAIALGQALKPTREHKQIVNETISWIQRYRPKMVVFVDSPKLNLAIAKGLVNKGIANKAGGDVKLLYYISPQILHWNSRQKHNIAKQLDSLAVIFPFEADAFEDTKLDTRFVGHPYLSSDYDLPVSYDPAGPILFHPGSEKSEIARIAPILFSALSHCLHQKSKLNAICVYPSEELKQLLQKTLQKYPTVQARTELSPNFDELGVRAFFTSSGTMSLNCALANIPGAMIYRAHPAKYMMGRMRAQMPYIGIANIILGKPLYPEYLQGEATTTHLAAEISNCIENADRIRQTRNWAAALRDLLDKPSTGGPADWLLDYW